MSENNTIRIRTTVGKDNFVKIPINQDFNEIEILSLKISQDKAYTNFSSDYGVVCGRVIINDGIGVPNCKVSIFVPITDEDKSNTTISAIYPYENIYQDKNHTGRRYNLLPEESQGECHNPVGDYPSKRKMLDNDVLMEIYDKYYKYTSVTNNAGDYMIFGVPVGNHIIHMDCDISDIGFLSQKPFDLIRNGANIKTFESYTKFKSNPNLDSLPQVKTLNKGLNVLPFWSGVDNSDMGITRLDFEIPYTVQTNAIFIGSLFTDDDANSLSRECRPRNNMGDMTKTITSEGTIEMLRETLDGQVERFDVEGGRVIDSDGTWSYQIPMNLNYVITDEFGNLIPSEDPTKGLATTAKVRFRISADQTGGEARLRTRASYLIPNNPISGDGNYIFDNTLDLNSTGNWANLRWNKLYTVRQFIPRYQRGAWGVGAHHVGIKKVDSGVNLSFPYNRIDTDVNPLYLFLCLLIQQIGLILTGFNFVIVPVINFIIKYVIDPLISAINTLFNAINGIVNIIKSVFGVATSSAPTIPPVKYVSCITVECADHKYAPGCTDITSFVATTADSVNNGVAPIADYGQFTDCISLSLAEALEIFNFLFYNDWINGTLYLPLLKYRKKTVSHANQEKLCELDCKGDFDTNSSSPNDCGDRFIHDVTGTNILGAPEFNNLNIREGLVKIQAIDSKKNALYYAAKTHNSNIPLFATDITSLGSTIDCDPDNNAINDYIYPVIHRDLLPSTYQKPDDLVFVESTESSIEPMFLYNNCFAITIMNSGGINQPQNIRRACELGIDLDAGPDINNINSVNNINNDIARRKIISTNSSITLSSVNDSFESTGAGSYESFRNITSFGAMSLATNNSFYFYFGINAGKTAIEKANIKYFADCSIPVKDEFIIKSNITNNTVISGNTGSIVITIIGGSSPFTYLWSNGATTQNISGLVAGTYTVTVTDNLGNKISRSFEISEPAPLSIILNETDVTTNGGMNGVITVSGNGGISPYNSAILSGPSHVGNTLIGFPFSAQYTGLTSGTYLIGLSDSSIPPLTTSASITVNQPALFSLNTTSFDITCFASNNGIINNVITGGVPPYTILTTGPSYTSHTINQTGLLAGVYNITASDSIPQTLTNSVTIIEPPLIVLTLNSTVSTTGSTGEIHVSAVGGTGSLTYSISTGSTQIGSYSVTGDFTSLGSNNNYIATVKDDNGCQKTISGINI